MNDTRLIPKSMRERLDFIRGVLVREREKRVYVFAKSPALQMKKTDEIDEALADLDEIGAEVLP